MKTALQPLPPEHKAATTRCNPFKTNSRRQGVIVEEWTPQDEFAPVYWDFAGSHLGELLVASTGKGIAYIGLTGTDASVEEALDGFKKRFPNNLLLQERTDWHEAALQQIRVPHNNKTVRLHLRDAAQKLMELCTSNVQVSRSKLCCVGM